MQYIIMNYSCHAAPYAPMTYEVYSLTPSPIFTSRASTPHLCHPTRESLHL